MFDFLTATVSAILGRIFGTRVGTAFVVIVVAVVLYKRYNAGLWSFDNGNPVVSIAGETAQQVVGKVIGSAPNVNISPVPTAGETPALSSGNPATVAAITVPGGENKSALIPVIGETKSS